MTRPKMPGNIYRNDPKFSERQVWTNSADLVQTAPDQGLHCLPFRLQLLDALLYGKAILFKFLGGNSKFIVCPKL